MTASCSIVLLISQPKTRARSNRGESKIVRSQLSIVVLLVGLVFLVCTEGIYVVDLQSFKPKQYPSETEWLVYLDRKKNEIVDGRTDTDFLNSGFLGGWNRCLERFAKNHDFMPWDYYIVQKQNPMDLGGNMTDTDRVAGQFGWRQATDEIHRVISSSNESELRSRIFHINYHIALLAGCGAAILAISVLWDLAKRKVRVNKDQPKQGTLEAEQ